MVTVRGRLLEDAPLDTSFVSSPTERQVVVPTLERMRIDEVSINYGQKQAVTVGVAAGPAG